MPMKARAEPTLTIVPRSRGRIRASAACVPQTWPRKVTSTARWKSAGSTSQLGENTVVMASLTQTSMGPSSASARPAAASTSAASATSADSTKGRPPARRPSSAAVSSPAASRAMSPTSKPRSAKRRAVARPTPAEAPVTTATLRSGMLSPLVCSVGGACRPQAGGGAGRQVVGAARRQRHDRERRVGGALRRHHAAVGHVQVGYGEGAQVAVDHALLPGGGHAAPPDEVGVALDGHDLLGAGGVEDLLHGLLGCLQEGLVVVALAVVEAGHREAVPVGVLGERDAVLGTRQELAQRAQAGPVHVVPHAGPEVGTPVALGGHVLRPGDRER